MATTQTGMERSQSRIIVSVEGAMATLQLAHPERRNCLDLAAWRAIPSAIQEIEANPHVRVLLLCGAGDQAFCAGADIVEFETARRTPEGSAAYERDNVAAFQAVLQARVPVIAAIRGICFGAGVGLAAAADIRIAASDALFAIPAARIGAGYPPDAMAPLVAAMGAQAVKRLFFLSERLGAAQALNAGFLSEVVPPEDLMTRAQNMAKAIAEGAPLTIAAAKRAINAAAGTAPCAGETLQAMADACFASADHAEGRRAFAERREPVFKGS